MDKKEKPIYTVKMNRNGYVLDKKPIETKGTLEELIKYFSYTLECGRSWEREKGRKKISLNPRNIDSLIKNVNNAMDNSARNGYSGKWLELVKDSNEKVS